MQIKCKCDLSGLSKCRVFVLLWVLGCSFLWFRLPEDFTDVLLHYLNFSISRKIILNSSLIFKLQCRRKKLVVLFCRLPKIKQSLNYWVFSHCSSNKSYIVRVFQIFFPFSGMIFQWYFKKIEILLLFCRVLVKFTFFFKTSTAILMTTLCVFNISDYVITFWYSHLHVLISELIQSKS